MQPMGAGVWVLCHGFGGRMWVPAAAVQVAGKLRFSGQQQPAKFGMFLGNVSSSGMGLAGAVLSPTWP